MTSTNLPALKPEAAKSPIAVLLAAKAETFKLSLAAKAIDWPTFQGAMIGSALRDPKLMEIAKTDPISLLSCASVCAQLGLTPGAALGEFYLIPRNNRVKRGSDWTTVLQCTYIIGYRGLLKLALQHPKVESIQPVLVYKDEEFDYRPADLQPIHHRAPFGITRSRDTLIGGYCLAWMRDTRRPVCVVLDMDDFNDTKSRNAKEGKSSPWDTDFEAMSLKTLIRRICKLLPTSTDLSKALEAEEDDSLAADARTATISVDLLPPTSGVAALENDERLSMGAPDDLAEAAAIAEDRADG